MSSRTLLAAAAVAALLPLAAQADSGAIALARTGVAGNGPGGDTQSSWNYWVAGGPSFSGQSATSTGTASGSATTAYATAHDTGADSAGTYAANAAASAELSTARVAATADNAGFVHGHGSDEGHPYAQIHDTLTFNAAGAGASTVSTFDVTFTIHSALSIAPYATTADAYGYAYNTVNLGGNQARGEVYYDSDTYLGPGTGQLKTITDNYPSAWTGTWSVSGADAKTLTFTGAISFTGASYTAAFREDTELQCYSGIQCVNDASVAFSLPTGVTMTSESGAFLTATPAVPEPQNAALLLAGLGALGLARRRRG